MAAVTSFRNDSMPMQSPGSFAIKKAITVVNGSANNADTIDIMKVAPGQKYRLTSAIVRASASLGAGATVQLRVAGNAVTGATTAGAASKVDSISNALVPLDVSGGDLIDLLVGGANITAGATITVDLEFTARS